MSSLKNHKLRQLEMDIVELSQKLEEKQNQLEEEKAKVAEDIMGKLENCLNRAIVTYIIDKIIEHYPMYLTPDRVAHYYENCLDPHLGLKPNGVNDEFQEILRLVIKGRRSVRKLFLLNTLYEKISLEEAKYFFRCCVQFQSVDQEAIISMLSETLVNHLLKNQ